MASTERDSAIDLTSEALNPFAQRLGFVGLVALLERLTPQAAPLGYDGPATAEAIRFVHDPSLTFNARDVSKISCRQSNGSGSDLEKRPALEFEVMTTFLGLTGAVSPLPTYLAEEIAQADPDRSLQGQFLDLFHHRLVSLLYRELIRLRLWGEHRTDLGDRWACRLFAASGIDTYETPLSMKIPPARILRLAPLLAGHVRSASAFKIALEEIVGDQLPSAVFRLREFIGAWTELEPESRTMLGRQNTELGRNTILGRRVFDRNNGFEVRIGPVDRAEYERFLPEGDLITAVNAVAELFVRDPLDYRVVLELAKGEAPMLRLRSVATQGLGRNTWLGRRRQNTFITAFPFQREPSPEPIAAFPGEEYHAPRMRGAEYAR